MEQQGRGLQGGGVDKVDKTVALARAVRVLHGLDPIRRDGAEGRHEPVEVDVLTVRRQSGDVEGVLVVADVVTGQALGLLEALYDPVHAADLLHAALVATLAAALAAAA